jgi:hypothetical protein
VFKWLPAAKCLPANVCRLNYSMDGDGNCLDVLVDRTRRQEKCSYGSRIEIGPISASRNLRTDSGSGGKADEG